MNKIIYESPIGKIMITENDARIVEIELCNKVVEGLSASPLLLEAKRQLEEYFRGKRRTFDLPLHPSGTEFQVKVWNELLKIPYGETRTYGEVSKNIGNPKGARSVGGACNKNPLMIVIPCHRVIGANGSLVGFGGGIKVKEELLKLES